MTLQTSKKRGENSIRKANTIGTIIGALYLPLGFYLWYLLLKHIQATDLIWFVWIIGIPLVIALKLIKDVTGED